MTTTPLYHILAEREPTGEARTYERVDLRGDGTEERRATYKFSSREAAQRMADRLAQQFPDMTYRVIEATPLR